MESFVAAQFGARKVVVTERRSLAPTVVRASGLCSGVLRNRTVQRQAPTCQASAATHADRKGIAQLLDEHPEITAFVAAEYQFAVLVHEVLASLGRLDGRTIACFDMPDLPFAPHDFLHVRQDERAMGRLAVDLLVAQVEDDAVPPVSIIPYVIVDPTTDR